MGPQVPIEIIEAARTGETPDIERLLVWSGRMHIAYPKPS